jgi:hypothetical protein
MVAKYRFRGYARLEARIAQLLPLGKQGHPTGLSG